MHSLEIRVWCCHFGDFSVSTGCILLCWCWWWPYWSYADYSDADTIMLMLKMLIMQILIVLTLMLVMLMLMLTIPTMLIWCWCWCWSWSEAVNFVSTAPSVAAEFVHTPSYCLLLRRLRPVHTCSLCCAPEVSTSECTVHTCSLSCAPEEATRQCVHQVSTSECTHVVFCVHQSQDTRVCLCSVQWAPNLHYGVESLQCCTPEVQFSAYYITIAMCSE